jgi:hypothetical protein
MKVRWRVEVGWEMRCRDCQAKRQAAYWPLLPVGEFWDPRNLARCHACNRALKRQRERTSASRRRYIARYRQECRGAIAIKGAAYYAANRERLNAYNRAYRAKYGDHIRELQRARYARSTNGWTVAP